MKKVLKVGFIVVACAFVLFLLLPFMVSESGLKVAGAQGAQDEAATPQIFTSNPLQKLVNKIARLFGKGSAAPTAAAPLTEAQAQARFGTAIPSDKYDIPAGGKSAGSAADNETDGQTSTSQAPEESLELEEGDWVLIQQTAPEGSVGGMHEINADDNAYERYVKYERAARFTPTAPEDRDGDVPDSKIARFFNPIKRFFGFSDGTPVATTGLEGATASAGSAARTGNTETMGRNRFESELGKFNSPSMDWAPSKLDNSGSTPKSSSGGGTAQMLQLLNPYASVDRAAELVADSKYPNPKDAKEQKKKEELQQANKQYFVQLVNKWLDDRIDREMAKEMANPQEGEVIGQILSSCAGAQGAFISTKMGCAGSDSSSAQGESAQPQGAVMQETVDLVNNLRATNEENFIKEISAITDSVHLTKMPEAAVTLVLGKADVAAHQDALQEHLDSIQYSLGQMDTTDPNVAAKKDQLEREQMLIQKYLFQIQNSSCSAKNPCFWVGNVNTSQHNPNEPAPNPQQPRDSEYPLLVNTVTATGVKPTLYTNITQKLDNEFAAYIKEQHQADNKDGQKEGGEQQPSGKSDQKDNSSWEDKARAAQTPYILVPSSVLKEKQDANKEALLTQGFTGLLENGSLIITGSAKTAKDVSQAIGSPFILFGNSNKPLTDSEDIDIGGRSNSLIDATVELAKEAHGAMQVVSQQAAQMGTANSIAPIMKEATEQLDTALDQFNKTGKTPTIQAPL